MAEYIVSIMRHIEAKDENEAKHKFWLMVDNDDYVCDVKVELEK